MEIEGRVKLSENVHNIWISARKPVVCPQTRYCIRRNIVPKFLKNAMKTLFAFCVLIMVEYLVDTKRIKNVLFRSNAHKKKSQFFLCASFLLFTSVLNTLSCALQSQHQNLKEQGWYSWLVRGLQCARSRVGSLVTSHPCFEFNFSPFCVALTSFKYP